MNTPKPMFVREVARIDDPQFVSGQVAGHRARRLIDAPDAAFADPFVLMAEDWAPQGIFAFHPHRGIETAEKMAVPRYQDLVASALPVRSEDEVEIRVFSGAYGDMISPTLNHLPVTMLEVRVENGGAFRHSFAATDNAFVYILEGAVEIGPAGDLLEASQLGWLTRSEEPGSSELTITARGTGSRFLLFAGQPLREPIAFGGPFVMNTQAEIQQAFADYRAGHF
jgi:redox-sensitive bicupin YhaK (pirin superfamily)